MNVLSYPIRSTPPKRVLIVNCYLDESHQPVGRPYKVPQALGPAFLAGAFARERCEVRLYNEHASGPLEDRRLLGWSDMLVLTGLTSAFDRMLHLTAYARTLNEKVIVVAGGPAIRALPSYSSRFFDYCCQGDVEQIKDVIADAFGTGYTAEEMLPRFDLAYWVGRLGYVESSRNCNFRCSFCSLTGEGNRYQKYKLDSLRKQVQAAGRKTALIFLDNNFYGNDRRFFRERLALLNELRKEGWFKGWAALVTNDFFLHDDNLHLAREAGCISLFSGVESLDTDTLRGFRKHQNTHQPQTTLIRKCLEAGILFNYGLILDVTTRRLADLRAELEFILDTSDMPLPSFLSLPIPLLGTPFFYECLAKGLLLPGTRLGHLNGSTLALRPLDPVPEVARFIRDFKSFRGYRVRALRHAANFFRRYRRVLSAPQMAGALMSLPLLFTPGLATAPFGWLRLAKRPPRRTYVSTTEPLAAVYQPAFPVASRYAHYFQPTLVTDAAGKVAEPLCQDLLKQRGIA